MDNSWHLRNMVRRWQRELHGADRAIILSPYITSSTADTILLQRNPENWEVYTVFEAELFASGSSSIKTLRRLFEAGCRLYHLERLHAKIVHVPDVWASLGSQNLTAKGTQSREATAITTDLRILRSLANALSEWTVDRKPIDAAMIDEMETSLPELVRMHAVFHNAAKAVDEEIAANSLERARHEAAVAAEAERARHEAVVLHARIERLQRELANTPSSAPRIGQVQRVDTGSYGSSHTHSLLMEQEDLTRWRVGAQSVSLNRMHRYLTLIENSGKLGWARVGKTRITFVGQAISWTAPFQLNGGAYKLRFEAQWDDDQLTQANLKVQLTQVDRTGSVDILSWFTPTQLQFVSMTRNPGTGDSQLGRAHAYLEADWAAGHKPILNRLLAPFTYSTKLHGVEAHQFFGPAGTRARIALARIDGQPLLVAKVW